MMHLTIFNTVAATKSNERLVVEDHQQRTRIISSIHDTCHLGLNRTNDMVAQKYYWPGMSNHIHSYVSIIGNDIF